MEYISPREAAKRLSVCTKTIYRRIADGSLPVYRLSANRLRIKVEDLEKFMQSNAVVLVQNDI
ncbi:MAG: helix-turn-helix domain-containing protein [Pseudoflavonifractor sp.]|nr:helix-turn-helix domain-containing protein [Pseudoflavonifractor sp.]